MVDVKLNNSFFEKSDARFQSVKGLGITKVVIFDLTEKVFFL